MTMLPAIVTTLKDLASDPFCVFLAVCLFVGLAIAVASEVFTKR